MSHFATMVVGNVENQLMPFHEFETTGIRNEYVKMISELEELKNDFEKDEISMVKNIKTGELFSRFNEKLFSVSDEISLPEEHEEIKITPKEFYGSFKDFLIDYCHITKFFYDTKEAEEKEGLFEFAIQNEKEDIIDVFRLTNPNAKWDWFVEGGRWNNFLLTKEGYEVNSAKKKDIDFEAMANAKVNEARDFYEGLENLFEGEIPKIKTMNECENRYEYEQQEAVKKMSDYFDEKGMFFFNFDEFQVSKNEYLEKARKEAILTFAFVKNYTWHERANMGWFGISTNERNDWPDIFNDLLESVDEKETITIVDCHI